MALKNINDFKESINTKGVIKTNKFFVSFAAPYYMRKLMGYSQGDVELLTLRCENVSLPGFSFASADGAPRLGYGPMQKHPYNTNYEPITLTFLPDAKLKVHQFFRDWMRFIVYNESRGNKQMTTGQGDWDPYEVGYKDGYKTDLKIQVYDDSNNEIMTYIIYSAFPMGLNSIQLSWADSELMRIQVPFDYTDFWVTYKDDAKGTPSKKTLAASTDVEKELTVQVQHTEDKPVETGKNEPKPPVNPQADTAKDPSLER